MLISFLIQLFFCTILYKQMVTSDNCKLVMGCAELHFKSDMKVMRATKVQLTYTPAIIYDSM